MPARDILSVGDDASRARGRNWARTPSSPAGRGRGAGEPNQGYDGESVIGAIGKRGGEDQPALRHQSGRDIRRA